jgi:hypothetical protein
MKPIKGMKEEPDGLPLMLDAWNGCVSFAISQPDIREVFKKNTGIDLEMLTKRSPIVAMIDKASGYEQDVIAKFADWVTVNLWGKSGDIPDDEEEKQCKTKKS